MNLKTTSHIALGLAGIACLTAPSSASVIFDQIASVDEMAELGGFLVVYSHMTVKQPKNTEPGFLSAGGDVAAVDDFEVKEGQNVLTQIDALMVAQKSKYTFPPFMDAASVISGWSVQIYSSKDAAAQSAGNGFAGDVASLAIPNDKVSIDIENEWNQSPYFSGDEYGLVSLDLGELILPAGQYWISVIVVKEPFIGISFGVSGSPINDGPGEDHNFFSVWQSGEISEHNITNLAYRIHAIPAPGAMALLGLAGVISRRRRRG